MGSIPFLVFLSFRFKLVLISEPMLFSTFPIRVGWLMIRHVSRKSLQTNALCISSAQHLHKQSLAGSCSLYFWNLQRLIIVSAQCTCSDQPAKMQAGLNMRILHMSQKGIFPNPTHIDIMLLLKAYFNSYSCQNVCILECLISANC